MPKRKYSASAVKESLWFGEFRKAVDLLNEGRSLQEIKDLSREENIFAAASPARARQLTNAVCSRVDALDDAAFRRLFPESDLATQKLFALAGAMARDALFFEFVYEVVREKMIVGDDEITAADVEDFFQGKRLQSDEVAGWTDRTLAKLGQVYTRMLAEAGVLDNAKGTRRIRKPILMPEFERWLSGRHMESYVRALTGVR